MEEANKVGTEAASSLEGAIPPPHADREETLMDVDREGTRTSGFPGEDREGWGRRRRTHNEEQEDHAGRSQRETATPASRMGEEVEGYTMEGRNVETPAALDARGLALVEGNKGLGGMV